MFSAFINKRIKNFLHLLLKVLLRCFDAIIIIIIYNNKNGKQKNTGVFPEFQVKMGQENVPVGHQTPQWPLEKLRV